MDQLSSTPRSHRWRKAAHVILAFALGLLLLESLLFASIRIGLLDVRTPSFSLSNARSRFWIDVDPVVGVWHAPGSSYHHIDSCFDLHYRANAYGARDRERSIHSDEPRIVVLGDSFVEGWGVARGNRFTDRLERRTGIEHLNFGTAGTFGPTQYYLLYQSRAAAFDHDAVLVGLYPANDFTDDDLEYGQAYFAHRYRPYLWGDYPDYELFYFRPNLAEGTRALAGMKLLRNTLRECSSIYNTISYAKTLTKLQRAVRRTGRSGRSASMSRYYTFSDEEFSRMRYAIEQIVEQAGTRPITLFTVPGARDLRRYDGKTTPLAERLGDLCESIGVTYVDLLDCMSRRQTDHDALFLECDGHWNALGHALAADCLQQQSGLHERFAGSAEDAPLFHQ